MDDRRPVRVHVRRVPAVRETVRAVVALASRYNRVHLDHPERFFQYITTAASEHGQPDPCPH